MSDKTQSFTDGYEATIRAELANEFLNEAKGRIITALHEEDNSNERTTDLTARLAHIHGLQQALNCNDLPAIEATIAEWRARLNTADALFLDPYCQQ